MTTTSLARYLAITAIAFVTVRLFAAEPLESVEQSAGEWVKLRVETTRAETEWREQQDLMRTLADALEQRATAAEEKRDLVKAKTAREREEFATLRTKTDAATADLAAFQARLETLSTRLIALRRHLPPRLSDALELSYRSLAAKELPVGERMQIATTILNRCAQFNRIVTTGEEVLAIPGESEPKLFDVIYWGLSHGYALDRRTNRAWLGTATDHGWDWHPQAEAAEPIKRLLAIAQDKADPDFVAVPAVVARNVSAGNSR